jgi:hypothetical protein
MSENLVNSIAGPLSLRRPLAEPGADNQYNFPWINPTTYGSAAQLFKANTLR